MNKVDEREGYCAICYKEENLIPIKTKHGYTWLCEACIAKLQDNYGIPYFESASAMSHIGHTIQDIDDGARRD